MQTTAYDRRISDLSSVVCCSDLIELSELAMDGDYVIAVEGRIDNTASASFTARGIEIGETARAVGIGAPVGGHIDAGQTERLTFTLASSARLVFDSQLGRAHV